MVLLWIIWSVDQCHQYPKWTVALVLEVVEQLWRRLATTHGMVLVVGSILNICQRLLQSRDEGVQARQGRCGRGAETTGRRRPNPGCPAGCPTPGARRLRICMLSSLAPWVAQCTGHGVSSTKRQVLYTEGSLIYFVVLSSRNILVYISWEIRYKIF